MKLEKLYDYFAYTALTMYAVCGLVLLAIACGNMAIYNFIMGML